MNCNTQIILEDLKSHLSQNRYIHSLNVAESAKKLAECYGGDVQKSYLAGLLHDMLKEQQKDDALLYLSEHGVKLTPLEKNAPKLWHAITGAVYAKEKYNMPNDIVNAIRFHTTGRTGMSTLEKILFTADFISADRDYDGVETMRKLAGVSLEGAMKEGLRFTVWELSSKCAAIHPDTIAAYNEIILMGVSE